MLENGVLLTFIVREAHCKGGKGVRNQEKGWEDWQVGF